MSGAHIIQNKSMVSIRCSCGFSFRNHELRGKSDSEIEYERDAAFARHITDMEGMGF